MARTRSRSTSSTSRVAAGRSSTSGTGADASGTPSSSGSNGPIGFACAFPHIAKAFRFGPESETVLHVRAFRPATFAELDLGRSDGYVEYACLAESVIADAEYRLWARARTVKEYLGQWVDWSPVAVADEGKLGRHYGRPAV